MRKQRQGLSLGKLYQPSGIGKKKPGYRLKQ